jgi:ABC-2 type transport system permease protein
MAVYKRSYRGYTGNLTPRWSRFLILTRYASRGIFRSRIITGLFVLCFFFPLIMIAGLYLNHNTRVLSLVKLDSGQFWKIDGEFFMIFMGVQSSLAFIMTAFIGPNMIAPDLSNSALPLYFCRPLSRTEYVLGRGCAILRLLSWITWVPGLILFGIECSLSGLSWGWEHSNFAVAIVLGSMLWIVFLALLALAISAWVRWRIVAGALLLAVMFLSSGFGAAWNGIMRTNSGSYLNPALMVTSIYANLFGVEIHNGVSTAGALIGLSAICGFCIYLLSRKVKAFEVVR